MILVNNVKLSLDTDFSRLKDAVLGVLKLSPDQVEAVKLYRKSVDARKKEDVHFCCSVLIKAKGDEKRLLKRLKKAQIYSYKAYEYMKSQGSNRPVVVGFGPGGIFAAYTLCRAGLSPIVIERGYDVDTRNAHINEFLSGGALNENSNVQFGEGGAGTFSDGKLNSGIKDGRCREVLECFVRFGAPENILYDAKPHIGTDVLKGVVKNIRNEIISLGGEIRFGSRLEDLHFRENCLAEITVNGEKVSCDTLILATGHSARDTFELLKEKGVLMEKKPFAMGVRIEHLQQDINKALYGRFYDHKALAAADYKLSTHLENGRGVFTFCMCPGGQVINASSENCGVAVNGMSENARDGENANSALLVGVAPEDIKGEDVLAGCYLQREIEQKAYSIMQGAVPITTVGHFVFGEENRIGRVKPTVGPKTAFCDLQDIYPEFITQSLKQGILDFDKKINGFADRDSIITAPETRSSSPVRIVRDETGVSVSHKGLFPCGEGAGYAGGIMSAAVDGMRQAENVINLYNNKNL